MTAFIKQVDLPILLLFSFLAVTILLVWARKSEKTSRWGITLLFGLLFVLTLPVIPHHLIAQLEQQFHPLVHAKDSGVSPETIKYVVVLGAASNDHPSWPITTRLGSITMIRLIEGIRIWRQLPNAYLVLSGGSSNGPPEADLMEEMAVALGVGAQKIIKERASKTTHEEAVLMTALLKSQPFFLVTSSLHMPRAVAIFQKQHLEPIPVPVGRVVLPKTITSWRDFLPRFSNAALLNNALYEYLGLLKAHFTDTV